ncbi:MAG: cytochrome P450 [Acidobacteriaceae bacterium]|nr:cytochrome P450 [Acidobacteriaceae bacterium]
MWAELDPGSADPLLPPRPGPAFYDSTSQRWVLSQYDNVLRALREPRLSLYDTRPSGMDVRDNSIRVRLKTRAALSAARLAEWRARIERLALDSIARLPRGVSIDFAADFARPWSVATATIVTGAQAIDSGNLEQLARRVSEAAADPSNPQLEAEATIADAELNKYFERGAIPMGGPAFVALSQTLPAFLANAWLGLLRHPAEIKKLRNQPDLMGNAVQELFRYAGLARKVSRHAADSVSVAGIRMSKGERATLLLASANRDPKQFPDPDRLDIARDAAGQVAFGAGSHSCVGVSLIRMAVAVATSAFVQAVAGADESRTIEWHGGSSFQWPSELYVYLENA